MSQKRKARNASSQSNQVLPGLPQPANERGTGFAAWVSRNARPTALTAGLCLGAALSPSAVRAASYVVQNANDAGTGSLRDAITQANSNSGADDISFAPTLSGNIVLASTLTITDSVSIAGPGADSLALDGNQSATVVTISPVTPPIAVTLADFTIQNGNSTVGSGGIAVEGSGDVTLSGMTLQDNVGGAVGLFSNNANLTVQASLLTGNSAAHRGGAIYSQSQQAVVTVQDSNIVNNTSVGAGGGVFVTNANYFAMQNSHVDENTAAEDWGGGLYLGSVITATISNSTLNRNVAQTSCSGAFQAYFGGSLSITDSALDDNQSACTGGAFAIGSMQSFTLRRSSVSGNTVAGNSGANGGGGFVSYTYAVIDNCTFANNVAGGEGGGLLVYPGTDVSVSFSTIVGNQATSGGGGIAVGSEPNPPQNVTVPNSNVLIDSSILYGNTADANATDPNLAAVADIGVDAAAAASVVEVTYTLIGAANPNVVTAAGGNLIGVDPLLGPLQNNGGPTNTLMPQTGSPAIDAGDPSVVNPATDQRGDPRVQNGRADMGAVETSPVVAPSSTSGGTSSTSTGGATTTTGGTAGTSTGGTTASAHKGCMATPGDPSLLAIAGGMVARLLRRRSKSRQ